MNCPHCKAHIYNGLAEVHGAFVLHTGCAKPYRMAQIGKPHKYPQCDGTGGETTETPRYHTEGGYNGFFDPGVQVFDGVDKHFKPCVLCGGDGYLATVPEPIVEPARVVGWRKKP